MRAGLLFLSALSLHAESVNLAWDPHPSPAVEQFAVWSAFETNGYWQLLDVIPATETNYTAHELIQGRRYWFSVTARTVDAESFRCAPVSYLVPLPAPNGLRVVSSIEAASTLQGPWTNVIDLATVPIVSVEPGLFYRAKVEIKQLNK